MKLNDYDLSTIAQFFRFWDGEVIQKGMPTGDAIDFGIKLLNHIEAIKVTRPELAWQMKMDIAKEITVRQGSSSDAVQDVFDELAKHFILIKREDFQP